MKPSVPKITSELLPAVGGRIGDLPEHFVVEEIPAYAPSGQGQHQYIKVRKTGRNTADVARRLAKLAKIGQRDVGYAGMKDRQAVTVQWFSICPKTPLSDTELSDLGDGIEVVETSFHSNKLRTGHLHGNRFQLRLVEVDPEAHDRAERLVAYLNSHGVFNAFGPQRFGRRGQNLQQALDFLDEPDPRRRSDRRQRTSPKLLASVVQSEIFNRYLTARHDIGEPLLAGEVVRLDGTKSHFVVEDVARELPRLEARDLWLTGPLPGPKTAQAAANALELERRISDGLLDDQRGAALARHAPGARRDLLMFPEGLRVDADGTELTLEFALPAGCYATQVAREFTRTDWESPRGNDA